MKRLAHVAVAGSLLAFGFASELHAQVTLDVSKITCDQYVGYKITDPQNIAMWLSGYYNAKRGNTVIDTQGFSENTKKLRDFCLRNPATSVMQASETLFNIKRD
jgi:acid stress chaperone HdeB